MRRKKKRVREKWRNIWRPLRRDLEKLENRNSDVEKPGGERGRNRAARREKKHYQSVGTDEFSTGGIRRPLDPWSTDPERSSENRPGQ